MLAACATPKVAVPESASPTFKSRLVWVLRDPAIQAPESAYYEPESKILYVSNVVGKPNEKDGQGWISKVDPVDGRLIEAKWVSGLNAPKGMRSAKDLLWVTDIDRVIAIGLTSGKIKRTITIKGAQFLNDIVIGPQGEVYVSDMVTSMIHVIRGNSARVFAKGATAELPNGLFISGNELFVAGWGTDLQPDFSTKAPGHLFSINLNTKKRKELTGPLGNLDGLEQGPNHDDFWVSDWLAGKVFHVDASGKHELVFEGLKGSADLGWLPFPKVMIIPQMNDNSVSAFQF